MEKDAITSDDWMPRYSESSRLSEAAQYALHTYVQRAGGYAEPELCPQAERVVEVLDLFAPEAMPPHALDAAALQALGNAVQSPNRPVRWRAAGEGLLNYFTYPSDTRNQRTNGYVGTLLGDMKYIDEAANGYQSRLDAAGQGALEGYEPMSADMWRDCRVGANVNELERISKATNLESQLARAALVTDIIDNGASDNNQELLKNIIQAESFYAPLLEIYGLHTFDMMLQSTTNKTRANKSGKEAVLHEAKTILDRAKQVGASEIMRHVLGRRVEEYTFKSPEKPLYGESFIYRSTQLNVLTDGAYEGTLSARFKTEGKYTFKMLNNKHYAENSEARPADVFGMHATLLDERQVGAFFAETLQSVEKNSALTFTTAPSKDASIFIRGSEGYVRSIVAQLPSGFDHTKVQTEVITGKTPDEIFQVAKFTAELAVGSERVPIEFQFQTKSDRVNARLGALSHMNHNAQKSSGDAASIMPGSPGALFGIHEKRYKVNPSGEHVLPETIAHGEQFKKAFSRSISS